MKLGTLKCYSVKESDDAWRGVLGASKCMKKQSALVRKIALNTYVQRKMGPFHTKKQLES